MLLSCELGQSMNNKADRVTNAKIYLLFIQPNTQKQNIQVHLVVFGGVDSMARS